MIVRIAEEGQFELSDELHNRLNELDDATVAAVDRGDHGVVELVEAVVMGLVEAVLRLARDADDHSPFPSSSCLLGSAAPDPSSAFIFSSSLSTCDPLESAAS